MSVRMNQVQTAAEPGGPGPHPNSKGKRFPYPPARCLKRVIGQVPVSGREADTALDATKL